MKVEPVKAAFREGFRRVWAVVDGNLASAPSYLHGHRERQRYVVMHVPTGARMSPPFLSKGEAVAELKKIQATEWRGQKIADLPACELIELAPIISKECFGLASTSREYLAARATLAELNKCP